jgi:AmmeMemoRadiSam system protein A
LQPEELPDVEIEISRLTKPKPLAYQNPQDLLKLLRPGIDGVLLQDGIRRATFLPQVWEKLPNPVMFLSHLCQKMGVDSNLWKVKNLTVSTYQVEMFHESELK